ncbi:MAG: hypothetical protein GX810_03720 [Clostridiales bacterium]|nr:hypothetical protein [Clostridiales bacterium]
MLCRYLCELFVSHFDRIRCTGVYFVPPYIPNVRAVVGMSSFEGVMTFTLSAVQDECWAEKKARFNKACGEITQV